MICPHAEDPAWFTLSEWAFTDPGNRPQTGDRSKLVIAPRLAILSQPRESDAQQSPHRHQLPSGHPIAL